MGRDYRPQSRAPRARDESSSPWRWLGWWNWQISSDHHGSRQLHLHSDPLRDLGWPSRGLGGDSCFARKLHSNLAGKLFGDRFNYRGETTPNGLIRVQPHLFRRPGPRPSATLFGVETYALYLLTTMP